MARTSFFLIRQWWYLFYIRPTHLGNLFLMVLAHWNNSCSTLTHYLDYKQQLLHSDTLSSLDFPYETR
jgi:hypothetical protein